MSASDPDLIVGAWGLVGLGGYFLWRLFVWQRQLPVPPDPWDAETEKRLHDPDAVELCHRCFTPNTSGGWFCKHCGAAVGPYNNLMPYIQIFSEGEVLRNGVNGRLRRSPLIVIGYLLMAVSFNIFFAPVFLFLFFRNLKRQEELPAETASPESPLEP
ncbi:MAG TPA: zinc ribbon domain-containing protein [Verrucomicrobiae bacterium]|nr:zinc ribbon domain-containing protein [Verrucomicrobiae bacterium]